MHSVACKYSNKICGCMLRKRKRKCWGFLCQLNFNFKNYRWCRCGFSCNIVNNLLCDRGYYVHTTMNHVSREMLSTDQQWFMLKWARLASYYKANVKQINIAYFMWTWCRSVFRVILWKNVLFWMKKNLLFKSNDRMISFFKFNWRIGCW